MRGVLFGASHLPSPRSGVHEVFLGEGMQDSDPCRLVRQVNQVEWLDSGPTAGQTPACLPGR